MEPWAVVRQENILRGRDRSCPLPHVLSAEMPRVGKVWSGFHFWIQSRGSVPADTLTRYRPLGPGDHKPCMPSRIHESLYHPLFFTNISIGKAP